MSRTITTEYSDPLDLVWTSTALALGIRIVRDAEVFVTWNGSDTLRIGTPESLDADDCLAQMIFHELCHALVAGEERRGQSDWGLVYARPGDAVFEHATLRLQAALADRHGLRKFLASTTDFRAYYDALPDDPLADDDDPAVPMALAGWKRSTNGRWTSTLDSALMATRAIAVAVAPFVTPESHWRVG